MPDLDGDASGASGAQARRMHSVPAALATTSPLRVHNVFNCLKNRLPVRILKPWAGPQATGLAAPVRYRGRWCGAGAQRPPECAPARAIKHPPRPCTAPPGPSRGPVRTLFERMHGLPHESVFVYHHSDSDVFINFGPDIIARLVQLNPYKLNTKYEPSWLRKSSISVVCCTQLRDHPTVLLRSWSGSARYALSLCLRPSPTAPGRRPSPHSIRSSRVMLSCCSCLAMSTRTRPQLSRFMAPPAGSIDIHCMYHCTSAILACLKSG